MNEMSNSTLTPPGFADVLAGELATPARHPESAIRRETQWVTTRDGVRLAAHLYLPPVTPAPCIAVRTPYGAASYEEISVPLCQRGYIVVCQDVRGTGASEPDTWDYDVYEWEDSFDFVEWITRQPWCDGFIGAMGSSYDACTQVCMASHPAMSAIAPEVGSLCILPGNGVQHHMFVNAYARTIGKGSSKEPISTDEMEVRMGEETLATGYFNPPMEEPQPEILLDHVPRLREVPLQERKKWLWRYYNSLGSNERAQLLRTALGEDSITSVSTKRLHLLFGHNVDPDAITFPKTTPEELCNALHAPALFITGWYDWGLGDTLYSWQQLMVHGTDEVRSRSRLLVAPSAHNKPGYHEGEEHIPVLQRRFRKADNIELLDMWYKAVRRGNVDYIPRVTYYLMGANQWRSSSSWPPREAQERPFYLASAGGLETSPAVDEAKSDSYVYDPDDPTPTMGGSILSHVYRPGSVDIAGVQQRADVLCYTTPVLDTDLDIAGPLRLVLYASSSAVETDFFARISDVFPDGRAIQLQNGVLRTRYRGLEPEALKPDKVYRFEIDMWATANRFCAGHRLRLDISSADFPKFQRNQNRGGTLGPSVKATQTVFYGGECSSQLLLPVLS
ncbi:CocE/NonD family hydrolase [Mesorhizobium opportunistum]|uniref:CocE/NonD family hydrolase n=1 Tax=Mesorhizobium opportunistum TaxID=593909 RepID=UPI003334CE82